LQLGFKGRKALQQNARSFTQGFALGGWADTTRGSLEQTLAQLCLESGQALGYHGRGNVEQPRGGRKTSTVAHRNNKRQITSFHSCL
jgi:hypothetical protein